MKQYILLADLDRCIGCRGGCQVACKTEHETSLGPSRSQFYTIGPTGSFPDLEMYFMPVMCQQCEQPACTEACPTGACYKDDADGVIKIYQEKCVGCKKCMKACPYNAIIFNQSLHIAEKCDLCDSRRKEGKEPACVTNCAGGALIYGDIDNPDSEVSKALKAAGTGHVFSLRDMGNRPSGKFILKGAKWQDVLPNESVKQEGKA